MTHGGENEALAARCEAAAGPGHELSADVHALVHGFEKRWNEHFGFHQYWKDGHWLGAGQMPAYTVSLDAAKTLYPVLPERIPSDPRLATAEALRARALQEQKP